MATKKTKKIETPIDERETFQSIAKLFAEYEPEEVKEKLRILYELQQADTEIDKIMQLRGELPIEVEQLKEEIAALEAKEVRINESVDALKLSISENKLNINECEELIAKYSSQVDNVANSREYDSLNKEIENQDLLRQIAIKNINEAKVKIEDYGRDLEDLKARLVVRHDDLAAKESELSTIVKDTSAQEAALTKKRNEYESQIDPRITRAYEHIRDSSNNHLAVVSVFQGNACGGCMNTVPPQRLIDIAGNKKLIICEYCGRILVNPDFE